MTWHDGSDLSCIGTQLPRSAASPAFPLVQSFYSLHADCMAWVQRRKTNRNTFLVFSSCVLFVGWDSISFISPSNSHQPQTVTSTGFYAFVSERKVPVLLTYGQSRRVEPIMSVDMIDPYKDARVSHKRAKLNGRTYRASQLHGPLWIWRVPRTDRSDRLCCRKAFRRKIQRNSVPGPWISGSLVWLAAPNSHHLKLWFACCCHRLYGLRRHGKNLWDIDSFIDWDCELGRMLLVYHPILFLCMVSSELQTTLQN